MSTALKIATVAITGLVVLSAAGEAEARRGGGLPGGVSVSRGGGFGGGGFRGGFGGGLSRVTVRDHRTPGPIIRDHRSPGGGVIIRDHRTPGIGRPIIRDHRTPGVRPVWPGRPVVTRPPIWRPPVVRPPIVRPPVVRPPWRPPVIGQPRPPIRPPIVRPPIVRPPIGPIRPPIVRPPVRPPIVCVRAPCGPFPHPFPPRPPRPDRPNVVIGGGIGITIAPAASCPVEQRRIYSAQLGRYVWVCPVRE